MFGYNDDKTIESNSGNNKNYNNEIYSASNQY